MDYIMHYDSPLGGITLASDGDRLTGLWFDGQAHFAFHLDEEHKEQALPVFHETERWLNCYFQGFIPDFTPPLGLRGTAFQQDVWNILLQIPYGKTAAYGEIAAILAKQRSLSSMSAQAVGNAVGRNPISLIVPCHRVVGSKGKLTGYAGGIEKKQWLLQLEKDK